MLKTKPTKLWLLVLVCAVLLTAKMVNAQTENKGVKLYDDPRLVQWSADFLAGKREQVLRSVEADLKSTTPHPFSAIVWLALRDHLDGREPVPADVKDQELKRPLFVLLDVVSLSSSYEYRELLRRYPAANADKIKDLWALEILFNVSISECRYDEAYLFGLRLARVHPDFFSVAKMFVDDLFEKERIRSKIVASFGKDGEFGRTEIGRLLQAELDNYATNFDPEEREEKFVEAWLKRFPNNSWAL